MTILYKGQVVRQVVVLHTCCLFVASGPSPAPGVSQDQQLVAFPSPAALELADRKQVHYTEQLMQHIGPGLQLQLWDQSLWAKRMGKCKVYWELSGLLASEGSPPPPRLLPRNEARPIFNFSVFRQGQCSGLGSLHPCGSTFLPALGPGAQPLPVHLSARSQPGCLTPAAPLFCLLLAWVPGPCGSSSLTWQAGLSWFKAYFF